MIRVFISQPMRGLTDDEILENRRNAVNDIHKRLGEDVLIISSIFGDTVIDDADNPDATALRYLARSIDAMVDADYVYFCKGFATARGCLIEYECAMKYGKSVIYEDTDEVIFETDTDDYDYEQLRRFEKEKVNGGIEAARKLIEQHKDMESALAVFDLCKMVAGDRFEITIERD